MVLDGKSAEKLYNRLHLVESDEGTYKVAFKNESEVVHIKTSYHLLIDG